ncbi:MAG TPA: type I DNA topoisomerase [Candidatus Absconditabacterales bacterium]|nr:type I DNA topoisomerase [Candidatus Absconditabacterales bacterium]HPK27726.1 type I DNA topoisomerase [Candidatus Absconditabacterales bacterium]
MAKNLVIVESPAKSETIKKILGSDFEVKASYGHVVDLPQKSLGVDVENNFKPIYEVGPDKKRTIADLKKYAKQAEKVWIATDEDREGEAIGRHVANELGLDIKTTARIVFHEITKKAIEHAIANPRTIDMNLVDAQQARRILDRLVGFELSPVLWKKISRGLSAGRVQSVAVRLIVEREREIEKFKSANFFKTVGTFVGDSKQNFNATLNTDFKKIDDVKSFLELCKSSEFQISDVETKPGKKTPSAPFTTSTLQQEASRKLGFSVSRTMQIAQKLYEAGHITYMRTDSVNLSQDAIFAAQTEITKNYGKEYSNPTNYKSSTKGAQEAHECIRPTHLENPIAGADAAQKKLYDLIRKRTIASQMAPAKIEKTKATINISNHKNKFIAEGEVVKFDGFLKIYIESNDDENEENNSILPKLEKGEKLNMLEIISTEKFKKHPPRYTEASLVKELEKKGIGRPSTYAPTISTIQKRGYVILDSRTGEKRDYFEVILKNNNISTNTKSQNTGVEKNKLFPTDIGRTVTDFLMENFNNIMDYNFTASVEEQFDLIASGDMQREKMLHEFYGPFHEDVVSAEGTERFSGERILGEDPKSGKPVLVRIGRFGPLVQIGSAEDEDKKFANIPIGKTIETITLEEALDCFKLPREVGKYEGESVMSAIGRFGPYVKYKDLFVSIPKSLETDPMSITLEQSIELIKAKQEANANKYIHEFTHDGKKVEVLNGPYGPYVKYNKKNYKIPKGGKDATDLTLEDCLEIISKK